jgi:hypothetical protein
MKLRLGKPGWTFAGMFKNSMDWNYSDLKEAAFSHGWKGLFGSYSTYSDLGEHKLR